MQIFFFRLHLPVLWLWLRLWRYRLRCLEDCRKMGDGSFDSIKNRHYDLLEFM
jgi:hypothetical protein